MERGDIMCFDFDGKHAQIADLHIKVNGDWFPLRILPDFKAATTLQVGCNAGMTPFRLVVCIGQHSLRHRVILQHPYVHLEHIGIPLPRGPHILRPNAHLLNANYMILIHIQFLYLQTPLEKIIYPRVCHISQKQSSC